jgi:hypothetical protein
MIRSGGRIVNQIFARIADSERQNVNGPFQWAVYAFSAMLAALCLAAVARQVHHDASWPANADLGLYIKAMHALQQGQSPYLASLYAPADPYAYPPLVAELVGLVSAIFGEANLRLASPLIGLACLVGGFAILFRSFAIHLRLHWVTLATAVALVGHVTRSDLYHGQVNFLIFLLLVAGLRFLLIGDWRLASLTWAVMIVCKPFMGVIVLYALWRRQWMAALATFAGSAVLFGVTFLPTWPHVIEAIRGWMSISHFYTSLPFIARPDNQSIYGLAHRLFSPNPYSLPWTANPGLVAVITLATVCVAMTAAAVAIPAQRLRDEDFAPKAVLALLEVGLIISLVQASGPLAEGDYIYFALPGLFAACVIAVGRWKSGAQFRVLWAGAALAWSIPFLMKLSPVRLPLDLVTPDTWRLLHGPGVLISGIRAYCFLLAGLLTSYALRQERSLAAPGQGGAADGVKSVTSPGAEL